MLLVVAFAEDGQFELLRWWKIDFRKPFDWLASLANSLAFLLARRMPTDQKLSQGVKCKGVTEFLRSRLRERYFVDNEKPLQENEISSSI
ncbi:hypothetical protein CGZ80_10640 [Rhodopirellula sp. MGV]|nr:hypothetical protein CGZ80_10640 [Rhodopirellula sp. MGV]PNY37217.1 hypothetical protein C2E31_08910 [Rhodopirellula baltica]